MRLMHVTGRLAIAHAGVSGAARRVIRLHADDDTIELEFGSLAELFAARQVPRSFPSFPREGFVLRQTVNVRVRGCLVARSRRRGDLWLPDRGLSLGSLDIVWAGLLRSVFAPARPS